MRATQIFPPKDLFFGSAQVLESLFEGVQSHLEGARVFSFLPTHLCSARVLESPCETVALNMLPLKLPREFVVGTGNLLVMREPKPSDATALKRVGVRTES